MGYLILQLFIIAQRIILSFIGPSGILLEIELQISKWGELKLPTKLSFWKMGKTIIINTESLFWKIHGPLFHDFFRIFACI